MNHSNRFAIDGLVRRMHELRDRYKSGDDSPELWQQWAFVRRVISRAEAARRAVRPAK